MLDRVLIDFTQSGRHRPQYRGDARGHAPHDFDQSLQHHLPGEVDIGFIGKNQCDDSNAVAVERAHLGEPGQPGHGDLDGYRDEAFDFFG